MSTNQFTENPFVRGVNEIRSCWGWFLALGIVFILFGAFCIVGNIAATFATELVFGWVLLLSAIVALFQSFPVRTWSGSFLYLLCALLRGCTVYLLIRYP